MEKEKKFREESIKVKVFIVLSITSVIIASLTFVFGIYFFGIAGIVNVLGIQYDSVWSLFWFVLFYFILDSIADVVKKAFMLLLERSSLANVWTVLAIHFLVIWSLFSLLNLLMESITITINAQLIAAAIIAIIEVTLNKNDKKEK